MLFLNTKLCTSALQMYNPTKLLITYVFFSLHRSGIKTKTSSTQRSYHCKRPFSNLHLTQWGGWEWILLCWRIAFHFWQQKVIYWLNLCMSLSYPTATWYKPPQAAHSSSGRGRVLHHSRLPDHHPWWNQLPGWNQSRGESSTSQSCIKNMWENILLGNIWLE